MFISEFTLNEALAKTKENGYCFSQALDLAECIQLESEVDRLKLEVGDLKEILWQGTSYEIEQLHARHYSKVIDVPVANSLNERIVIDVKRCLAEFPELIDWCPTEAGYQLYRGSTDFISPHRDRKNDHLLSVTITIRGSAVISIFEPIENFHDYTKLKKIDEIITQSGMIMFLRAPGFGNSEQVIHSVSPPITENRLILNLRMRNDILKKRK